MSQRTAQSLRTTDSGQTLQIALQPQPSFATIGRRMILLPLSPHGAWLERLHQKGELYKQIVDTTFEGVWVIDAEGLTVFANEQMARILRCGVEEMNGAHLFSFMDEEGRSDCVQYLEHRKHGVREQHEFRFCARNGEEVWTLSMTPQGIKRATLCFVSSQA